MRLVCLNLWGGLIYEPLMEFIAREAKKTDIFCFQEVFTSEKNIIVREGYHTSLFSDMQKILVDFDSYFSPIHEGIIGYEPVEYATFEVKLGHAIFVRRGNKVNKHGAILVHEGRKIIADPRTDIPRIVEYVQIENKGQTTIMNFHGIST